ncbi:MAG: SDR family NAD(P)-dependent oxidoreductase [Gammaproteobacteria bacterium]
MTDPLAGLVAIVTGAGSGLGAATAQVLARRGVRVMIDGRREARLAETVAAVRATGGDIHALAGDVSQAAHVEALVAATVERYGGIDIVVNNAALRSRYLPVHEIAPELFSQYLAVNLLGPFMLMRAAIPHLLARGGGSVINVGSTTSTTGLKYTAAYSASKGGLLMLTRTAALDYADRGIRINCICPAGMTPTDTPDWTPLERERVLEAVGWGSPMGAPATTLQVAELIAFLANPASGPITGACIPIDGGWTAR